jgi:hypothetical protein
MARSNIAPVHRYVGILLAMIAVGCGTGDAAKTAPVSGAITLNGQPLANATVVFQPQALGNPGPPSYGTTNDAGKYTLLCEGGKAGAVIGTHLVSISTRIMRPSPENSDVEIEVAKERVPEQYRLQPPKFEVSKAGTADANFELAGPPPAGR